MHLDEVITVLNPEEVKDSKVTAHNTDQKEVVSVTVSFGELTVAGKDNFKAVSKEN